MKEYDVVESGIENEIVKRNLKPYWTTTWINKFQEECIKWKIVIVNEKTKEVKVTKNKLLMEHAVQYVEERRCSKEVIGLLNHVWLLKKYFYLLSFLVQMKNI